MFQIFRLLDVTETVHRSSRTIMTRFVWFILVPLVSTEGVFAIV